jgi:hypothetical protein
VTGSIFSDLAEVDVVNSASLTLSRLSGARTDSEQPQFDEGLHDGPALRPPGRVGGWMLVTASGPKAVDAASSKP